MSDRLTMDPQPERMLKWFEYAHLPEDLQQVSRRFTHLAVELTNTLRPGPERTVALRKLLESKDAAVRQAIEDRRENATHTGQ